MNLELFIARRLVTGKQSRGLVSRSLVNITTFGISLGLAVMIVSVSVVTGFKNQVSDKVVGFGAHLQIENFDSNSSYETNPISDKQDFIKDIRALPGIKHIQTFAIKPGIIMTREDFQGVVMKGVGKDYDWSFFKKNLIEGRLPKIGDSISNEMLVSVSIARMLKLKAGQDVAMYFVQQTRKMRRMHISGIYETGLAEFDKIYVIADIRQIRQLNDWAPDQITGFEISITDFDDLAQMKHKVHNIMGLTLQNNGSALLLTSIVDKNPQIFDWLNLQNLNVWVILIIMILVAGCIMTSGLLILILERTKMIGLLASLGARSANIRKIFLYQAGFLILRGLFWGNLIGIGLCAIEYHFHLIRLDQASYYISSVPVDFSLTLIGALNLGTLTVIMLLLLLPSLIISKISPAITLRYN